MNDKNLILLALDNDLVELTAQNRLYWMTRQHFHDLIEISKMIESILMSSGNLSSIHYIVDEAATLDDMRARYVQWKNDVDAAARAVKQPKPKTKKVVSRT